MWMYRCTDVKINMHPLHPGPTTSPVYPQAPSPWHPIHTRSLYSPIYQYPPPPSFLPPLPRTSSLPPP